jgi:hypothetical protein
MTTAPRCGGEAPANPADSPFFFTSQGWTVHWASLPGCIAVTYDAALADHASALAAATEQWNALLCTGLCFSGPTVGGPIDVARRARRIHFVPQQGSESILIDDQLYFDQDSGRILSALVQVQPLALPTLTQRDLFAALGKALGLNSAYFRARYPGYALDADASWVDDFSASACQLHDACAD